MTCLVVCFLVDLVHVQTFSMITYCSQFAGISTLSKQRGSFSILSQYLQYPVSTREHVITGSDSVMLPIAHAQSND